MSTLLDIGAGALEAIGMLGVGQTPSPEDGQKFLRYANLLLSQWSTQRLFLYYVAQRQYALTALTSDYTIGPSGGFAAVRPTLIESGQVNVPGSNIWLPMSVLDKPKWDALIDKGSVGDVPDSFYPEYSFPNVGFHINPAPRGTPSVRLGCWEPLAQFATLFDVFAFPPGYEEFMESTLATVLAPLYDQPISQALMLRQQRAEAAVMKINAQSMGGALGEAQTLNSPNVGQPIPTGQAQ